MYRKTKYRTKKRNIFRTKRLKRLNRYRTRGSNTKYSKTRYGGMRIRKLSKRGAITNRKRYSTEYITLFTVLHTLTTVPNFIDQKLYLAPYIHQLDRVGMMFGLEIRPPFLEHTLTEYGNQLPEKYKIKGDYHKYILRKEPVQIDSYFN